MQGIAFDGQYLWMLHHGSNNLYQFNLAGDHIDGTILNNYANLLLAERNYVEALSNYETALDDVMLSRTDVAAIHLNRALCLRAMGRYDAAKDAYLAHQAWLADPLESMPPAR